MIKILILGFLIRLFFIFLSSGIDNYDLNSYFLIGRMTFEKVNIYPEIAILHYPYFPFFLYIQTLSYYIGQNKELISIILKLIIIFFDLGIILLIYLLSNKNKEKALFYAINPITILIFSFHGQFDSLPIFFLLLSIYFLKFSEKISLLFLSIGIMIKTWPIIFLLNFYKKINDKKIILLILIFPIFSIIFYSILFKANVFDIFITIIKYQGVWGVWGISLFFKDLSFKWQKVYIFLFLFIFFICSFFINRRNIIEEIFKLLMIFIIFSPSFSIQYFSWFIPFLLLIKPKNYVLYILLITFYLIFNYFSWINRNYQVFFDLVSFFCWFLLTLSFFLNIKKKLLF